MNSQLPNSLLPPRPLNQDGQPRRVGVELELSGLELDQLTELIQKAVGGRVEKLSDYEARVLASTVGSVRVEFDASLFREMKIRRWFDELDSEFLDSEDKENLERTLASVAAWLVPFELVFEPIFISRLSELEKIRIAIGDKAEGTNTSTLNAFGLHLNPELPALDVDTLLDYLRAFLILYEELKQRHDIDPARTISGFIGPFPKPYTMLVLNPGYRPDLNRFIEDYLSANPTRNRPLDLLPVLAYLDERRVRSRLPEEKISPRPALHYRLPNSLVDEADWSISREWAVWMKVERLAADRHHLLKRCRYELKRLQGPLWYWLRRVWRTKPLLSSKPLIAITGPDKGGFPAWVCTALAVRRAGGHPMRLTPSMFRDDPTLPPFDGLVLGGGADVDPQLYGQELQEFLKDDRRPKERSLARRALSLAIAPLLFLFRSLFSLTASGVDQERDEFESSCLERALRENLPVLGICRGAQFINIHFGGTLLSDLSSFYGEVGKVSTVLPRSKVRLAEESSLREILGSPTVHVNSLHSQAVDQLGDNILVCARDEAGVVQAVEAADNRFVIGVQWHPEYLPVSRVQQRLFQRLTQEALSRKY